MGKNACTGCNLVFGSLGAFDQHRIGSYGEPIYKKTASGKTSSEIIGYTPGTRRCLTLEEIKALGWIQNNKGQWITGQIVDIGNSSQKGDTEEDDEPIAASVEA